MEVLGYKKTGRAFGPACLFGFELYAVVPRFDLAFAVVFVHDSAVLFADLVDLAFGLRYGLFA